MTPTENRLFEGNPDNAIRHAVGVKTTEVHNTINTLSKDEHNNQFQRKRPCFKWFGT